MQSPHTLHLLHTPQGIFQGGQRAGLALGLLVCREVDLQLPQGPYQFFVCVSFGRLLTTVELKRGAAIRREPSEKSGGGRDTQRPWPPSLCGQHLLHGGY